MNNLNSITKFLILYILIVFSATTYFLNFESSAGQIATFFAVLFFITISFRLYSLFKLPFKFARLMNQGQLNEALEIALEITKGPSKYKNINLYNLANIYTWKGDFTEADSLLNQIDFEKLSINLRDNYHYLRILSYTFQNNLEMAQQYLSNLKAPLVFQQSLLLQSYIADKQCDAGTAERLINDYMKSPAPRTSVTKSLLIIFHPKKLWKPCEKFFLGNYYLTRKREEGMALLRESANCPFQNVYSDQAKKSLAY